MIRSIHPGPAALRIVVELGGSRAGRVVTTMVFAHADHALSLVADFRAMADKLEAATLKHWPVLKNSANGQALSPVRGAGGEPSRFAPGLKFEDGRWQRDGE